MKEKKYLPFSFWLICGFPWPVDDIIVERNEHREETIRFGSKGKNETPRKGPLRKPTAIIVRGFDVPFRLFRHCGGPNRVFSSILFSLYLPFSVLPFTS